MPQPATCFCSAVFLAKSSTGEHMATLGEMERDLQREFMLCPDCNSDVHTVPAEGVPVQQLRACVECDNVFWMDLNSKPRYTRKGKR